MTQVSKRQREHFNKQSSKACKQQQQNIPELKFVKHRRMLSPDFHQVVPAPGHGTRTPAVISSAFVLIQKLFLKAFQLSDVGEQIHPLAASELLI